MQRFGHIIGVLEDRVTHIEANMGDFTNTVNDIIDTLEDQSHDTNWIKDKIADIEDRSHQNNIKIRRILESLQPADQSLYAQGPIKAMLLDKKNI